MVDFENLQLKPQVSPSMKSQFLTKADIVARNEQTKKATKAFESLFTSMMLKEMRKATPKSNFLNGGAAEGIFNDMFDNSMAEQMVSGHGFGLAEVMYRQLEIKTE